jgi:hypothetical protein
LVITDEGVQISGKVNADNVEGLGSWITTNRDSIEGLYPVEAKNLLDSLNALVTDETNGLITKVSKQEQRIDSLEEATNFYDSNNMMFIKNKNINNSSIKGSFY